MLGFSIGQNEGNENTNAVPQGTASVFLSSLGFDILLYLLYVGILITGSGNNLDKYNMAEIYVPELQKTCSLGNMTLQRYDHTQNGFCLADYSTS